jgi:hypothetical protein
LVEQRPFKAWVLGSIPSELTTQCISNLPEILKKPIEKLRSRVQGCFAFRPCEIRRAASRAISLTPLGLPAQRADLIHRTKPIQSSKATKIAHLHSNVTGDEVWVMVFDMVRLIQVTQANGHHVYTCLIQNASGGVLVARRKEFDHDIDFLAALNSILITHPHHGGVGAILSEIRTGGFAFFGLDLTRDQAAALGWKMPTEL